MAAPAAASGARAAAGKAAQAGGLSKGKGDLPGKGDWRQRSKDVGGGKPKPKGAGSKALSGSSGKYRRMLIAEFIVCVIMLGLSPLAKGSGEMGPVRFMKRGSATCALFIILGLVSSGGRGAARAASAFGALIVVVLLVDQREAFGSLATLLTADDEGDAEKAGAGLGPDDSTDAGDEVMAT
jgi:hypothetical protein